MTQTIGQIQTTYQGKTYTGLGAIAAQVLADGGTTSQAYAAVALANGPESSPADPINVLSGGKGPAAGLFQFEPGTWAGAGGTAYGPSAADATWQEQVQVFLNDVNQNGGYASWAPDFLTGLDPNNPNSYNGRNPTAPAPGSAVANSLADLTSKNTNGVASLLGNVPAKWADVGAANPANPVPGPAGYALGLATGGTIPGDLTNAAGGLFSGIEAVGNFFNLIISGFGIGWHAVLTIIGGALLIIIGLFVLFRHQAAGAAETAALA